MKFKFSLQSVLEIRRSQVEALEIQLGQLVQIKLQILEKLEALDNRLHSLYDELQKAKQESELDLPAVLRISQNIDYTKILIERANEELAEIEERIEQKRLELVAAKQAEEAMGILKEKEYQEYLEEEALIEKRDMDDIYIARAYRLSKEKLT